MNPKHFFRPIYWSRALIMLAAFLLFACGKGKTEEETEGFVDKGVTTPAGQYPIVKEGTEPITLEIFSQSYDQRVDGPFTIDETNGFLQWLQKKTGVSLNFTTVNAENITERVNVMMATGDVPDIMLGGLSGSEMQYYGENGLLRSFTPYIEKYGSIINEVFEAKPVTRPMISDLEGNIFALPRITECYHCFRGPKAFYFKPWLDDLGLEVPQTTEEFYEMLKAFKTQDPNGNGQVDEIPLTGSNTGWDSSNIFEFLAGSFLYTTQAGSGPGLTLNGDKVVASNASPEYRELLRYLNRLYSEGLITDLTFTMSTSDYRRTVDGSNPPVVGVALSQYPGVFTNWAPSPNTPDPETGLPVKHRGYESFYPLSPLEGPKGIRYANAYNPYVGVGFTSVMSTKNPYPALTFRLLETIMLPEATVRAHLGIGGEAGAEGVDYYIAPEGTKTLTDEDALWVRYNPDDPYPEPPKEGDPIPIPTNNPMPNRWNTVDINGDEKFGFISKVGRLPPKEGIDPDRAGYEEILQSSSNQNYEPYNAPASLMLPPLIIPTELTDELEDLNSGISEYIGQESVKFVRGEKSAEDDWETYLEDLDGLGLPRYLEIYQQLYDEQKDRWAAVR